MIRLSTYVTNEERFKSSMQESYIPHKVDSNHIRRIKEEKEMCKPKPVYDTLKLQTKASAAHFATESRLSFTKP